MKYFNSITNLKQAKLHYRKLAKQLHPDKGGSAVEFQKMQQEYKTQLIQLQQKTKLVHQHNSTVENELIGELGKLAKVLVKKQVPQIYLRHEIKTTNSSFKKKLFNDIISFLDEL